MEWAAVDFNHMARPGDLNPTNIIRATNHIARLLRLGLCSTCCEINLDLSKFLTREISSRPVPAESRNLAEPWIDIGSSQDIETRGLKCRLCRLIFGIIQDRHEEFLDVRTSFYLRRRYSYRYDLIPKAVFGREQYQLSYFSRLLLSKTPRTHPTSQDVVGIIGHVEHGVTSSLCCGRMIHPSSLDIRLINEWIHLCEAKHSKCNEKRHAPSEYQDGQILENLKVIDVAQKKLVTLPLSAKYAALSYVWGDSVSRFRLTKENERELSTAGFQKKWQEIPQTIRDAIDLVQALDATRERKDGCQMYLWVDALCIVQDDDDIKLRLISHMDTVYSRAFFTIIAANGADPNAGLPGVRPETRSVLQRAERIHQHLDLISLHHHEDRGKEFAKAAYSQRAWTFQEELLSIRSLVFLGDAVHFQCGVTNYYEDLALESSYYYEMRMSDNYCTIQGKEVDMTDNTPSFRGFKSMVYRYTGRRLTYATDILRAFSGLSSFISQGTDTFFRCGLPFKFFDLGLLWRPEAKLERRTGFPSWCWSGWVGRVGYWPEFHRFKNEDEWKETATYIDWRDPKGDMPVDWIQRTSDSTTVSKEKLRKILSPQCKVDPAWFSGPSKISLDLPPREELLSFWALSARFHLRELAGSSTDALYQGPTPYRSHTFAHDELGVLRLEIQTQQSKRCGNILVNSDWWYKQRTVDTRCEDKYVFIILSESEQPERDGFPFLNVLLVQRALGRSRNVMWGRVGAGLILKTHLTAACSPGPRWEFFNLE